MRVVLIPAFLMLAVAPAMADDDRPVTDAERAQLEQALAAQTCTGGRLKYDDDGYFKVDHAMCADGLPYDFKFSLDYRLLRKKFDD